MGLILKLHVTPLGENASFTWRIRTATSYLLRARYNDLQRIAYVDGGSMPVTLEMQHAGDISSQAEVRAVIEHVLADRPGDWRVSIVGSQANDRWEMQIAGPNAFERSYMLEGSAEHRPEAIRVIVGKMLPR